MKVWLDDVRSAPRGWRRARRPEEAIALLETGKVTEISLDHDLGIVRADREATGYDVLLWLEQQFAENPEALPLPVIHVHSANAAVYTRMEQAIASIRRLAARKRVADGRS
jgi:hypothetical protein